MINIIDFSNWKEYDGASEGSGRSEKIWLKSDKTDKAVCMHIAGFPYLGIWSTVEGAPFVCLEPWFGITDKEGHNGDFTKKEGIIELNIGEEFSSSYAIEVI